MRARWVRRQDATRHPGNSRWRATHCCKLRCLDRPSSSSCGDYSLLGMTILVCAFIGCWWVDIRERIDSQQTLDLEPGRRGMKRSREEFKSARSQNYPNSSEALATRCGPRFSKGRLFNSNQGGNSHIAFHIQHPSQPLRAR